jgi:hypothetical protein
MEKMLTRFELAGKMESAVTKKRTDVVKKKKRGNGGEVGEKEDKGG